MTARKTTVTIRSTALAAAAVALLAGCGQAQQGAQAELLLTTPASPATSSTSAASAPSSSSTAAAATSTSTSSTVTPTRAQAVKPASRHRVTATITTREVQRTRNIDFDTQRVYSDRLTKGTSRVTRQGVDGTATVTIRQTLVDGKVVKSRRIATQVTTPATDRVVLIGTRASTPSPSAPEQPKSSSGGLDLRRSAMWDRIAQCESTGNWSINTGNGYYGGLQFDRRTWLGAGGGRFAPRADLASRAQQITIANRVYDQRGLQPWACRGAA